jgi:putative endonuclease
MKPGWFVYILQCGDGTLYTGVTVSLERRLDAHQRGVASKYTRARLPVRLVYQETRRSRAGAQRREAAIKKMARHDKLRLLSPGT